MVLVIHRQLWFFTFCFIYGRFQHTRLFLQESRRMDHMSRLFRQCVGSGGQEVRSCVDVLLIFQCPPKIYYVLCYTAEMCTSLFSIPLSRRYWKVCNFRFIPWPAWASSSRDDLFEAVVCSSEIALLYVPISPHRVDSIYLFIYFSYLL